MLTCMLHSHSHLRQGAVDHLNKFRCFIVSLWCCCNFGIISRFHSVTSAYQLSSKTKDWMVLIWKVYFKCVIVMVLLVGIICKTVIMQNNTMSTCTIENYYLNMRLRLREGEMWGCLRERWHNLAVSPASQELTAFSVAMVTCSRLPSEDGSVISNESEKLNSSRGLTVPKVTAQQKQTKEETRKRDGESRTLVHIPIIYSAKLRYTTHAKILSQFFFLKPFSSLSLCPMHAGTIREI